jgi:DNA-binding MarR family transcriptional regulator
MPASRRHAWYQTLRAYTALLEIMDAELQADCGVPLAWYDVLIEINNAPDQTIRMRDLADKVLLSRSWLTRRIAQLESAGLVERRSASGDGRGVVAAMTTSGRKAFVAMERSHAQSIQRHFSDHIDDHEATVIAAAFARIGDHGADALGHTDQP